MKKEQLLLTAEKPNTSREEVAAAVALLRYARQGVDRYMNGSKIGNATVYPIDGEQTILATLVPPDGKEIAIKMSPEGGVVWRYTSGASVKDLLNLPFAAWQNLMMGDNPIAADMAKIVERSFASRSPVKLSPSWMQGARITNWQLGSVVREGERESRTPQAKAILKPA